MSREALPKVAGTEREKDLETIGGFADFVRDGGYSADQVREAYYRLCGVSDEEHGTPEIETLTEKMRELAGEGIPLNWFATYIGLKQEIEDAVPTFHGYVDSLEISDNEKKVLKSIVDNERRGEITCLVDGKLFSELKIENNEGSRGATATALAEALKEMAGSIPKGKKYEFTFSES